MNSEDIQAEGVRGGSHSVGRCRISRRSRDAVREGSSMSESWPRVLNLEKESSEHLKWTHLEQVQHCTDLPRQVTFPPHTEQEKMGPGLG